MRLSLSLKTALTVSMFIPVEVAIGTASVMVLYRLVRFLMGLVV